MCFLSTKWHKEFVNEREISKGLGKIFLKDYQLIFPLFFPVKREILARHFFQLLSNYFCFLRGMSCTYLLLWEGNLTDHRGDTNLPLSRVARFVFPIHGTNQKNGFKKRDFRFLYTRDRGIFRSSLKKNWTYLPRSPPAEHFNFPKNTRCSWKIGNTDVWQP